MLIALNSYNNFCRVTASKTSVTYRYSRSWAGASHQRCWRRERPHIGGGCGTCS
uniref:Beta-1,4-mannan synthase n=1 Tax=Cyamopsis tetragonoloba TaxID=3832 RepID=A0A678NZB8_CYATE|nr:beta-1,4-mannan synthase [Cyamopsis tetragonoloba]